MNKRIRQKRDKRPNPLLNYVVKESAREVPPTLPPQEQEQIEVLITEDKRRAEQEKSDRLRKHPEN